MAGYSRIYIIGEPGGHLGADGVSPIKLQILVGNADRQWLEPHYFDGSIRPLGGIRTIVPARPDHREILLDACLAFYPDHFSDCPSLGEVRREAEKMTQLDFHLAREKVPMLWPRLREEARGFMAGLSIWEAELRELEFEAN